MKRSQVFLLLFFLFVIGFFVWWQRGTSAVNKNDTTLHDFLIEKGVGVREIANKLKNENLIQDPVVFFLLVKKEGLDGKIQAGDFRLSPSMNALDIAESLTHGMTDIWVTIPEGKRAEEIAAILKEKIPSYQDGWRTIIATNEGYLFPDTYLIPKDADIALVISLMKNNFDKKYQEVQAGNQSKNTIVIIASLIEREAKSPEDKRLVSSVIYNRLRINMPIQLDATVQYATASIRCNKNISSCDWWSSNISQDDLDLPSLYNTYKNPGLPPGPIANPGLISLQAAANPAKSDYLYYISDKKGIYRYGKTIDDHHTNISKYGLE